MIELIQHGMYLVNGFPCESVPVPPAEARRETMAYKILQAHTLRATPRSSKSHLTRLCRMISHMSALSSRRALPE